MSIQDVDSDSQLADCDEDSMEGQDGRPQQHDHGCEATRGGCIAGNQSAAVHEGSDMSDGIPKMLESMSLRSYINPIDSAAIDSD